MLTKIFSLRYFETLAKRGMILERFHPAIKIIITFTFIIFVSMADKYEITKLLYLSIIPICLYMLSDLNIKTFSSRLAIPALLAVFVGILNPFLDKNQIIVFGLTISAGWLSFLVLVLKSFLSVSMVMLLIISTSLENLYSGFIWLKFPKPFAIQLVLMVRYISVFIEELDKVLTAYSLRSGGSKKLDFKVWGSLVGQFFIRSSNRSHTLFHCMKLRGFDLSTSFISTKSPDKWDVLALIFSISIIVFLGVL